MLQDIEMYMNFLILLRYISTVSAGNGTDAMIDCNGVVFNNVYYDHEVLFEGLGKPYNLVMHKSSGYLFFSHTIQNGLQVDFGIMACHIKKKTCRHILGIDGGYAVAYDRINNDIFFGGHNGIYKYNFRKKRAEYFAEKGKSIWSIFIRHNFYYIQYPTQALYIYKKKKFAMVAAAVDLEIDNFFVSQNYEVYFSNTTGSFKMKKMRHRQPIILNDEITVRQITENSFGDVYFCATNGIYVEDVFRLKAKKIADIDQPYRLDFINVFTSYDDTRAIIYSDIDTIYLLNPGKYRHLCLDAVLNDGEKTTKKRRRVIKMFAH